MLNRKFLKSSLINGSLILLAVAATAEMQIPAIGIQKEYADSSIQTVTFDPELLQVNGLNESDSVAAPTIFLNQQALNYAGSYLSHNDETLGKIRDKSPVYFHVMDSVFNMLDMPVQLKYLAVVESELKTTALSRVGAVGAWQLMPETARNYSLKVSSRYDERKMLFKSTMAAAKYLNYLHGLFDDWLLTIAAYNAGPGSVNKAIRKSGSRNFWKLQNFLPLETRLHVKRFISTHYYFEGVGSVTTLTKQEVTTYAKKFEDFVAKHNATLAEKSLANTTPSIPLDEQKTSLARLNVEARPNDEKDEAPTVIASSNVHE